MAGEIVSEVTGKLIKVYYENINVCTEKTVVASLDFIIHLFVRSAKLRC